MSTLGSLSFSSRTTPKNKTQDVIGEVHLVKSGVFRKFDRKIVAYTRYESNVQINIDYNSSGFFVSDWALFDEFGYARVVVDYVAHING